MLPIILRSAYPSYFASSHRLSTFIFLCIHCILCMLSSNPSSCRSSAHLFSHPIFHSFSHPIPQIDLSTILLSYLIFHSIPHPIVSLLSSFSVILFFIFHIFIFYSISQIAGCMSSWQNHSDRRVAISIIEKML